jgi:DUF971 family protein
MPNSTQPVVVKLDREERTVHIEWQDGHESTYSWAGLRATCPCVDCRGGHAAMAAGIDPELMRDPPASPWCIERLRPVGNYALGILWDDGHNTGIHAWHMLRGLCPCDECRERAVESDL